MPRQISYYACSRCNTILKETSTPIDTSLLASSEACPTCGSLLRDTLAVKRPEQKSVNMLFKIHTAHELASHLTFDIPEVDRLIDLSAGDRLCLTGSRQHANLLMTRLWVRALMPLRHGGIASKQVICIDGGNATNVYQCVNFARQYGLDIRSMLRHIVLSRAFTIHQLASLIVRVLPDIIQRIDAKMVAISDLLAMFVNDPQVKHREAQYLITQIIGALAKLPTDILVIMSLYTPAGRYEKAILPAFNKRLELADWPSLTARLYRGRKVVSDVSLTDDDLRIIPACR